MPDTSELEMPGSSGESKIPGGVMLIGAVAGIVGLVLLLRNSGGGGTTAAGTSINAALGSIQEENMNLLGVTQAGFMQTSQQMAGLSGQVGQGFTSTQDMLTSGFLNTQQGFGSLGEQIGAGFTQSNNLIGSLQHDLSAQISAFSDQSQTNYSNLMSLVSSGQATSAQVAAAQNSLLASIQQDVSAGLIGQQQATSMLQNVEGGIGAIQANQANMLNWEYMINARVIPGNVMDPSHWPGGVVPAWFNPPHN